MSKIIQFSGNKVIDGTDSFSHSQEDGKYEHNGAIIEAATLFSLQGNPPDFISPSPMLNINSKVLNYIFTTKDSVKLEEFLNQGDITDSIIRFLERSFSRRDYIDWIKELYDMGIDFPEHLIAYLSHES